MSIHPAEHSSSNLSPFARQRFELLTRAWELAYQRALQLNPYASNAADELGKQLHLRIIDLTAACLGLFESSHVAAIPVLLRTIYEALVDQLALQRDPAYAKRLVLEVTRQGGSIPDRLNAANKAMRQAFIAAPGAREKLRLLGKEQDKLEAAGVKAIENIQEKFEAADVGMEYPIYRFMSGAVHSAGDELNLHYLEPDENGTRRLVLFKVQDESYLVSRMDIAMSNLLRSCRSVHGEQDPEFLAIWNTVSNLIQAEELANKESQPC